MPTIKSLSHRNECFDGNEWEKLAALYEGGKRFRARLGEFLPQRPAEPYARWMLRKDEAVYRNYFGPIVDYFTALLFSSKPVATAKRGETEVELDDYYAKFREDCDRKGADVDAVFKSLLTQAMIHRCAWLRIHQPDVSVTADATREDFNNLGAGDFWISEVSGNEVIDWGTGDTGLEWAITHSCTRRRDSIESTECTVTLRWEHLLPDRVDVYQIEFKDGRPPAENTEVPLAESKPHRFGAVPLVCLELPVGLWIGNRLESPQLAHFRLSNAQTWGMTQTCYSMPVFKVQDAEKFKKAQVGAGYGFIIQPTEGIEHVAPPSAPFAALAEEVKSHKDEIYRIAEALALGVENNAAAVGRSAESKQSDAEATKVVLLAFSRVVKETMERVYDIISRARGEQFEWSVAGIDDFAAKDLASFVDVLERVDKIGGIPSKTFKVASLRRVAESALPDMDERTKQTVREEIEAGVDDQSAESRAEREMARMQQIGGALDRESQEAKREQQKPPPEDQKQ